jgi:hypothetical protein
MSIDANVFHKKVGQILQDALPVDSDLTLLLDPACGGIQHIPLFCDSKKSRASEFCNVDALVLKDDKIKMIIEIEESNVKPTQICGKFLTSALAKYYIHESKGDKPVEMGDKVFFIQILDSSKLAKGKTKKVDQWKKLEASINNLVPMKNSQITLYKILTTEELSVLESLIKKIDS